MHLAAKILRTLARVLIVIGILAEIVAFIFMVYAQSINDESGLAFIMIGGLIGAYGIIPLIIGGFIRLFK